MEDRERETLGGSQERRKVRQWKGRREDEETGETVASFPVINVSLSLSLSLSLL